ncbi:hypothetical protein BDZ89DRAFT_1142500 [Hymenopellis radicata]|nr:hypothetical protein BDZ89DRAFT_1142500 [Hymenopellis radicata]
MRLPLNRIIRKVTGYRLGYNVQRDYPGRWTTPVVIVVYVMLAVLLALMNIPLTAYDTVQEYTYTPNATIPPLPFSYLVPSFLNSRLPDFAPETLHVGDVLHLNNSSQEYTVASVSNNPNNTGENFLYHNNPLTSCDVESIEMQMIQNMSSSWAFKMMTMQAHIDCWFPVKFALTSSVYVPFIEDMLYILDDFP